MTKPLAALAALLLASPLLAWASSHESGPIIVPRDRSDPSIHEPLAGPGTSGFKQVTPLLGRVPASYNWFAVLGEAIGSMFRQADPAYLGFRGGIPQFSAFRVAERLYRGFKGLGGQNISDVAQLGTPGGNNPGDPFWVAFPRPGNTEIPPPFQTVHYEWDCFCRYDEKVACPTGAPPPVGRPIRLRGENLFHGYGGAADYIDCAQCFGLHNIRKHDKFVGTKKPNHRGYPKDYPTDSGYQECLRQSVESFAGTGAGGITIPNIYGL